ncbi:hypothetical protein Halru_1547 [Halovivax ruber XH-70]|uniref:Uncharacterized protein n=2 Tax=Halovivax TaxID=332951 RepID=L0IBL1_HALRX|nr:MULTISPECIES: hypothetical protein [Halovivax]AGB16154.1 hypothetical protein Halru_1547 [Halovivax ruber XH-70]ELZ14102.1 hypothetical protein C479_00889 [Halovivax asiaticus JCM 14624]
MPTESRSRCVRCRREPGYNRAVIDLVSDDAVGALCRNCELDVLPATDVFERGSIDGDCGCPGCERDATVSFPRWLPTTTVSDGVVESRVEYTADENPFALCDEHYDDLVSGASLLSSPQSAAAEHR